MAGTRSPRRPGAARAGADRAARVPRRRPRRPVTTGKNPLTTYRAIFDGAGFNWFFPWVHGDARDTAASNLQQTLIATTTLILTGLAVAFAFRCGLFNIGGTGPVHRRLGHGRVDRLVLRRG